MANNNYKKLDIELDVIGVYKNQLILEMEKLGVTKNELPIIPDATIRNAIKRNRKPEDVAWAILQ